MSQTNSAQKEPEYEFAYGKAANDERFDKNPRFSSADRIRKVDRSDIGNSNIQKNNQIRNVRSSSMPGNSEKPVFNGRKTTDQIFNDSYNELMVQSEEKVDYEGYLAEKEQEEFEQDEEESQRLDNIRNIQIEHYQNELYQQNLINNFLANKKSSKIRTALRIYKAVRVSQTSWMVVFAIILPTFFIQFFLSILNLVGLGLAGSLGFVSSILDGIKKYTGFDMTAFDPKQIFAITMWLNIGFMSILLLTIYFLYQIRLINPIFGRRSELKVPALIITLCGYILPIPLVNMIPWALVWVFAITYAYVTKIKDDSPSYYIGD